MERNVLTYWDVSLYNLDILNFLRARRKISCLAPTGFAHYGKGMQLVSGYPCAETDHLSPPKLVQWFNALKFYS